jgi:hypothetical protein
MPLKTVVTAALAEELMMNAEISAKFATFTAALTMTALIVVAVASMFNVPVPERIVRAYTVDDARSIHDAGNPADQMRS